MSQITDIVAALVADVTTALTSYKSVDSVYTATDDLREGDMPKAMVFNPGGETERLGYKQVGEVTTLGIGLVRKYGEAAEIRTDVEAIITQIESDTTLGSKVDDALVNAWEIDETRSDHTFAVLTVQTLRVN
jgi:hypothetical protein